MGRSHWSRARGIGAETSRKMAAAGASVVIGDVLADRARETAEEITRAGGEPLTLALDVTTERRRGRLPSLQQPSSSANSTFS
jgi:NAD(P)-dependent dehydrogenase (short-subunit alcohol dehydrogenase family)